MRRSSLFFFLLLTASCGASGSASSDDGSNADPSKADGGTPTADAAPPLRPGAFDPKFGTSGVVVDRFEPDVFRASSVFLEGDDGATGWSVAWIIANGAKTPRRWRVRRVGDDGELGAPSGLDVVLDSEPLGAYGRPATNIMVSGAGPEVLTTRFTATRDALSVASAPASQGYAGPWVVGMDRDGRAYLANGLRTVDLPFELTRLGADGRLDTTYGTKGTVTRPNDGGSVSAAAPDADGRVLFAGWSNGAVRVGRYDANGREDASFTASTTPTLDLQKDGVVAATADAAGRLWIAIARATGPATSEQTVPYALEIVRVSGGPAATTTRITVAPAPQNFSYSTLTVVKMIPSGDGVAALAIDDAGVLRILAIRGDGALDPTFGDRGVATTTMPSRGRATSFVAWPKDRLTAVVALGRMGESGVLFARVGR
jgi:hypothetical protein